MPYSVGRKGSYGCAGYPVIKDGTSEVMGCHPTRARAEDQIAAINISENKVDGANPSFTIDPKYPGVGVKRPTQLRGSGSGILPTPTYQKERRRRVRRGVSGDASYGSSGAVSSGGSGGSIG